MTRVLIADDQVLIRAGLAAILRATPGYVVVGEADDGDAAIDMAAEFEPDVVLMDLRMPQTDGIRATRAILEAGRETAPRILVLTIFDRDQYVYDALRAGASGFLLKDTPPERLLSAIKAVADGDMLFSPSVTRRLVESFCAFKEDSGTEPHTPSADLAALTIREKDVVRLVAAGLNNAEIGQELTVTEGTVKTHLNRVMAKLNLSSRAQVVVVAYETGLVVPRRADRRAA